MVPVLDIPGRLRSARLLLLDRRPTFVLSAAADLTWREPDLIHIAKNQEFHCIEIHANAVHCHEDLLSVSDEESFRMLSSTGQISFFAHKISCTVITSAAANRNLSDRHREVIRPAG